MVSVFDPVAAKAARDDAMYRVDRAASAAWKAYVTELIVEIARTMTEFTTDDVEMLRLRRRGPSTHEPRALGPLMRAAARAGVCAPTGIVRASVQVSNHNRPMQVWRSLIYRKPSTPDDYPF
jgi:hypothetical protein